MKYLKAQNVLPKEVITIIQEFIDGEFIYIPRKDGQQRAWGEKSGARNSLKERNRQIYAEYIKGVPINSLISKYYLSEQSIRRIISMEKGLCSKSIHSRL
ncbi:CD3324 family protein [Ruminiclostridium cellobioparum]|uniref:Mor transcription activator family n=1 Tax=Ruminiclostridium cellobioparum subsp. termitidis CT1112 TaxID=1195236 RepID=S0FL13_RUMCE|nr:CD3324 family protein [Ruminiclostridium cellobioparum]EMS69854.1 Mor transcription activator family [Ruminiclostridium cellobioparum subsp. termitidis CT1112]